MKFIDERLDKVRILGDRYLLDIAISNLIGNSVKYNIDGGNVEVKLSSKNGSVLIEICDDGRIGSITVIISEKLIPGDKKNMVIAIEDNG